MRSNLQKNISECGFTLLELIIVLILISILSAISTPLFKSFIRKVHSAAGNTSIPNIKKECTPNKDLHCSSSDMLSVVFHALLHLDNELSP